jgi:hypothetical protein
MQEITGVPRGEVESVTAVTDDQFFVFNNQAMQGWVHCEKGFSQLTNLSDLGVFGFFICGVFAAKN